MFGRRRFAPKQVQDQERAPHKQSERAEAVPAAQSRVGRLLLADSRLALPANVGPRASLLQAGQRVVGNTRLQAILSQVEDQQGRGRPLEPQVQTQMASAFGDGLNGVRVHTGTEADRLTRTLQARAFTAGQEVFFGEGEYQPHAPEGQRLLAHELAHVVQQQRSPIRPEISRPGEPAEREAAQAAVALELGEKAVSLGTAPTVPLLARVDGEEEAAEATERARTWLRGQLADKLELVAQGWQIMPGEERGTGNLRVQVASRARNTLRRSFESTFRSAFPRAGRELFRLLGALTVEFSVRTGTEYAGMRETSATWRAQNWESRPAAVNLLRRGGPVSATAVVRDGSETVATLTQTLHVVAPGVSQDVAGRVLGYRETIEEVCREMGMRPDIVMAIISMESAGHPESGGTRGPYFGLMQAHRMTRESGETTEAFQARVRAYQANIRQQIVDGVTVFQSKKRAMERMGFQFDEPMTESDIVTIEVSYGAGEGTVQAALRRARNAGRADDWHRPEFLLAAVVEMGAHHPPFLVARATRGWTGEQFKAELMRYCGLSEEEVNRRYQRGDGTWNTGAMRDVLTQRVQQRRVELRDWIRQRAEVTLQEIEAEDRWVYQSAQMKYENLTGEYMERLMGYRRYYESVLAGRWVPPLLANVTMEEEVITVPRGEQVTPPEAETGGGGAGAE